MRSLHKDINTFFVFFRHHINNTHHTTNLAFGNLSEAIEFCSINIADDKHVYDPRIYTFRVII